MAIAQKMPTMDRIKNGPWFHENLKDDNFQVFTSNCSYYVMNPFCEQNHISSFASDSIISLQPLLLQYNSIQLLKSTQYFTSSRVPFIFIAVPSGARGPAHYVQGLPSSIIVWVCNDRKLLPRANAPRPPLPFHRSALLHVAPQPAIKKGP